MRWYIYVIRTNQFSHWIGGVFCGQYVNAVARFIYRWMELSVAFCVWYARVLFRMGCHSVFCISTENAKRRKHCD